MPGPSRPKKRRITGDDAASAPEDATSTGPATTSDATQPAPAPRKSHPNRGKGRVTAKGGGNAPVRKISSLGEPEGSSRYTPPSHDPADMPSPTWVPVLMFTFFGLGMITIPANYVELLPGGTSNWYLLLGLGFILGGIITATQYR